MLRTNLSTRPFYNERAVHLLLGLAALLIAALTAVTLYELVQLSRHNTELSSRVDRDRSEASRLSREATRIRRGIDQDELQLVVGAAREANTIIDQRTFSWTQLFNHIEGNIPPDVMLSAVQPNVTSAATRVTMVVLARRLADIDEFIEKLEGTGAFEDVLASQVEEVDGVMRAVVDGRYVAASAETEASPAPAKTNGESR